MSVNVINRMPGPIIDEVKSNAKMIKGTSASEAALYGIALKGPIGKVVKTTSWSEWKRIFGDFDRNYPMSVAAYEFYQNGGVFLNTVRIAHYSDITNVDTLTARKSEGFIYDNDKTPSSIGEPVANESNSGDDIATSGGSYTGTENGVFRVKVTTGGAYGGTGQVSIYFTPEGGSEQFISVGPVSDGVSFSLGNGVTMTLTDGGDGQLTLDDEWTVSVTAEAYTDADKRIKINSKYEGDYYNGLIIYVTEGSLGVSGEFKISVRHSTDASVVEDWDNLSLDETKENYFVNVINDIDTGSEYIEVEDLKETNSNPVGLPQTVYMINGSDGDVVTDIDYIGDITARTGKFAFLVISNLPLVFGCPDKEDNSGAVVIKDAIDFMDTYMKFSFFVFSIPENKKYQQAIDYIKNTISKDSTRAACYYPRVRLAIDKKLASPTGAILGLYARFATEPGKGIWWSPGGVDADLKGVIGLEFEVDEIQGGLLNENRINNIIKLQDYGIVVWGARTLTVSQVKDFRYIGARRNTSYLESSIKQGTLYATIRPNDENLWESLRLSIDGFLFRHWRAGGLKGKKKDEAYYVICDESLNTTQTIDQGKVIAEWGIRNKKTSEFVISRVVQLPSGLDVVE